MARDHLITSESVSEGHPDKMCDQISDAVLDAVLEQDRGGRVACETMVKTGMVIVAGEITTTASIDFEALVREQVNAIGYDNADVGFDGSTCGVLNLLGRQSGDIAMGVDETDVREQGAGDQGMMYGYATGRDGCVDAGSDHLRPPTGAPAIRGTTQRLPAVAAPGCKEPGHLRLRERPTDPHRRGGVVYAARSRRRQ